MRNIIRKNTEKGVSNYTYDKAYRLTGATHPTLTNETFSYDKVGNRLTTQANVSPWTYNNADQLLTTPEATYQYNPNGHTKSVDYTDTNLPDMAYSYDARERLKRVLKTADSSEIQSNRYDYNNRRLVKTTASATAYFLYNIYGLEAEFNSSGNLIQGYLFGADSYSTNPILTYKKSGSNFEYHYYHSDHLFTPQRLTDSTGVLSWSANYSAFGKTTVAKETITNNLRFPGQYADSAIGLNQNYFRDYSAELGRYIESDPIGLNGGINFYGYVGQKPLLHYDETGQFFWVPIGAAVITGTGLYLYYKCLKSCDRAFPPDPECAEKNKKNWNCRTKCLTLSVSFPSPGVPSGPGLIHGVSGVGND